MKFSRTILSAFFLLTFFSFSHCKKDKTNPIDELPAETQTGANTFGCLVNRQVFKPGGASLSGGSLQCNYQYLGNGINGGYYFVLSGRNQNNSVGSGSAVGLFTDSLKIEEGQKYSLKSRVKMSSSANYLSYSSPTSQVQSYLTNGFDFSGQLWVKKLDTINQIVSGTFWFDAVNGNNEKVEIREGRFDMHYTR